MHGKLRKKSSYAQKKSDGTYSQTPVKEEEHFYKSNEYVHQWGIHKKKRLVLDNEVKVLIDDIDPTPEPNGSYKALVKEAEIGVQRELCTDVKDYQSIAGAAGVTIGIDFNYFGLFGIFAASVWPEAQINFEEVNTAVTNKHIMRSGIIDKVIVRDAQSEISTENKVFDPYTGQAVLTSTTDLFNQPKYNYNIPAHIYYGNFEPSYENWGMEFSGTISSDNKDQCLNLPKLSNLSSSDVSDMVRTGDICAYQLDNLTGVASIFINNGGDVLVDFGFNINNSLSSDPVNVEMKILRPIRHNRMTLTAQELQALSDPLQGYQASNHSTLIGKTVDIYNLENVLEGKVMEFRELNNHATSDVWLKSTNSSTPRNLRTLYLDGSRGIYEEFRNLSFRSVRESLRGDDFKKSGVYSNFYLYDHNEPYFLLTDVQDKWQTSISTQKVNRNSAALNNVDLTRVYFSQLDNYIIKTEQIGDASPINESKKFTAKIEGGEYYESAFCSFESYETDYLFGQNGISVNKENKGHFDFHKVLSSHFWAPTEVYEIVGDLENYGEIIFDKEYPGYPMNYDKAEIYFTDNYNSHSFEHAPLNGFNIEEESNFSYGDYTGRSLCKVSISSSSQCPLSDMVKGYIMLRKDCFDPNSVDVTFSDSYAHTGKRSLQINGDREYIQRTLSLKHGDKYHFSCWVHDGSMDADLASKGVSVVINNNMVDKLLPSGNRIEGWQKIEGSFIADANGSNKLTTSIKFDIPNGSTLYIDDVRIIPISAKMEGFVYDHILQRVSHVLDENNYFTEFIYDGDGQLVAINKETDRGIRTIQEQKNYISIQSQ